MAWSRYIDKMHQIAKQQRHHTMIDWHVSVSIARAKIYQFTYAKTFNRRLNLSTLHKFSSFQIKVDARAQFKSINMSILNLRPFMHIFDCKSRYRRLTSQKRN